MRSWLALALVVVSAFCIDSYKIGAAEMQYTASFSVYGDSGTITVLEHPITTRRQTVSCSPSQLEFPPYELNMSCDVSTNPGQSFSFEEYEQTSFTGASIEMTELARSLATNSSFQTALNIASWIRKNLEYDPAYGEIVRTASQTFNDRRGTCDEWAHLFIALMKSLDYDARYVAGYAYGSSGWEPHAWAEVWTEYGWQAFDPTFAQYGYIDGTHIAFSKTAGGTESYYNVSYIGQLEISDDIKVEIIDYSELELAGELSVRNASSGEKALMVLKVSNPFKWRIGFDVSYGLPKNLDISLLDAPRTVSLLPGNNTFEWMVQMPDIDANHKYLVPVSVGLGNFVFSTDFNLTQKEPVIPGISEPSWFSQFLEKLISLFDRFLG